MYLDHIHHYPTLPMPPKPYYSSSSQPHVHFLPHFCLFASVPALDCRPATGHHFVPEPTKEDLRIR